MNYGILKVSKVKGINGVIWAGKHNTRERDTPNADPDKTPSNTILVGAKDSSQLAAMWRDRASVVERKIKKDAVSAIEYVITASPEAWKSGKLNDRYLEAGLDWVTKRHGKENILQAVIHRDETSPHLHVLVIPIQKTMKKYTSRSKVDGAWITGETTERPVAALTAKPWLNGRRMLQEMQTAFHDAVGAVYGLIRGEKRERPTYQEIRAWAAAKRAATGGQEKPAEVPKFETYGETYRWVMEQAKNGNQVVVSKFCQHVMKDLDKAIDGYKSKVEPDVYGRRNGATDADIRREFQDSMVEQLIGPTAVGTIDAVLRDLQDTARKSQTQRQRTLPERDVER